YRSRALTDRWKLWKARFRNPAPDGYASRSRLAESATAIRSPKTALIRDCSTHAFPDTRSPGSSTPSDLASRGGNLASVSAWAGMAGTADPATHAGGGTFLLARHSSRSPVSLMTALTPIT